MAAPAIRQHAGTAMLVAGSKAIGGASIVVLNVWIAHHLSPSAYGLFVMASTAALLVDGIVGAAVDAAVIGRMNEHPGESATRAERAGMVLKLGAGAVLCLAVTLAALVIGGRTAGTVAGLAMAAGTGLLVHRSVLVYLQLRERFAPYALLDLAHTAARWTFVAIVLGTATTSAATTMAAYAAASWSVAGVAALLAMRWRRQTAADTGDTGMRGVAQAAWLALATTGIGALVARLDIFLIGTFANAHEAGIFGAASALALAPTWLGAYLAPVFTARILPYCREQRLSGLLRDVQRYLLAAAVAGIALGFVIGPRLIERLLPAEYAAAGTVVPVLLIAGAAGFVTFPLVLHTLLFLAPRTYLVMDLVSIPVLIPVYVISARETGALGVAWVTAIAALVKAAIAQTAAGAAVRREQARVAELNALLPVL